jgi:integrase
MAGRKMPYLTKRGNVYWYRRGIPADIQHIIAKGTHWYVSLRTTDSVEAKRLSGEMNVKVQKAFDVAQQQIQPPKRRSPAEPVDTPKVLDAKEAVALVAATTQEREQFAFHAVLNTERPDSTLKLAKLRKDLVMMNNDDSERLVAALFEDMIREAGYLVAPQSPAYKVGFAKFRAAMAGAMSNAVNWAGGEFDHIPDYAIAPSEPPKPIGMTVAQVAEAYAAERGIADRQLLELRAIVRQFTEVVGDDIPICSITREHCFQFKTLMQKKPSILTKPDQSLTLPQLIAKYDDRAVDRLSIVTVRKNLSTLQTVLAWAESNGQIERNPMKGIVPAKPKRASLDPKRLPFSTDDIRTIFTSPLYTGVKSDERVSDPGKHLVNDHRFWLPFLGLWTGCRLEELGQADADDVKCKDGIWFLDVTTLDGSGKRVAGKSLKTVSSKRMVPLHPTIIEAGFLRYIEAVKGGKLFPMLVPDRFGTFTAGYSKIFGRWLDTIGITDQTKVYHSFRHTFKDACRAAQIPIEIHDRLTGHAPNTIGGAYGQGVPLSVLSEHMNRIVYPTFPLTPERQF